MNYLSRIFVILVLITGCIFAKDVSVTIYNNNLALVRDARSIALEKGTKEFRFTDVASQIDPTSVHFTAKTGNRYASMLEQNYEYDLVGTHRLLEKYIDQNIIATISQGGGTLSGKLLSAQGGDVIVQTDDGSIRALKASSLESVQFASLPGGLITRPTLVWLLNAPAAGDYDAEISYLTRGINWHAEYVALINDDDTELDLSGWVSVENNSGADYKDAKLKLVAGDVNQDQDKRVFRNEMLAKTDAVMAAAPQFEEKSFFEYHLYTMQRPATVKDRQIKQLSLFPPAQAKVKKVYTYQGQRDGKKVRVTIELDNSKNNGLGMPMPEGKIRVYKADDDGSQQFIGEDRIDHTPKDEKLRVYLGNAFDVVGERSVIDVKKIGLRSRQETVKIELRNHKDEKITVHVLEHLYGDWEFIGATPKIFKKKARKVEFEIEVPANGEQTLEYTVLFK